MKNVIPESNDGRLTVVLDRLVRGQRLILRYNGTGERFADYEVEMLRIAGGNSEEGSWHRPVVRIVRLLNTNYTYKKGRGPLSLNTEHHVAVNNLYAPNLPGF